MYLGGVGCRIDDQLHKSLKLILLRDAMLARYMLFVFSSQVGVVGKYYAVSKPSHLWLAVTLTYVNGY